VNTPKDGSTPTTLGVYDFNGKGVAMLMYNTDEVRLPQAWVMQLDDIADNENVQGWVQVHVSDKLIEKTEALNRLSVR
jgi:hypothetical protein